MSKKKKHDDLNSTAASLSEFITNEYLSDIENDATKEMLQKLPLLLDNNLACKMEDTEYLAYGGVVSIYRIFSKYITKFNKSLKTYRRPLREFEFGGNGQIYAQNDRRLVELSKYGLDAGTYIAELDKTSYTVFEVEFGKDDNYEVTYRIWFIGKKWKKHRDEFMKVVQEYRDIKKEERHETIRYTNGNPPIDAVFKPFDKVVFTGKEHLLNYIDNFIKNIPEYYRYGMTPKLSIMLHGEPGTGKSTVARALANYLNIPSITSVSPDYFEADNNDNNKNSRFRATRFYEKTVWVLDDCDCICKSREDDDSVENTKILSSLLSFLDNPPTIDYEARDGIIYPIALVVATTNYYDRLDAAVKRHGRFDLTIEMKEFNREEADEMCAIYSLKLEDVLPKKEIDVKNFRISPSKLQAICLENIDKSMKSVG